MKKKMFIAGMSLAVALVLLATASFAFITLSTAPEVKGMQMTLSTGRTLLLAPGNGTNTAPAASEFSQYISLSSNFAGLAPLRPVSTADGVNWYLPAYNTEDGTIGEISEFILDDTLEHGNVSLLDANGNYLTEGELRQASANGYYVYADFWMKTEEDGAKVRLSIPHLYGTAEERHSGTVSEYGLGAEELQSAVYGTYVLGEPELDESDSTKLAVRTEEPETALRLGFLVYQDTETLEPITSGIGADGIPDGTVKLPFKIYEPNADKRAAGTAQELLIPDAAGSAVAIRDDYIAGSSYSDLADNTYYMTQPIAKTADGGIELTTVPAEDMIVQLKSEWDNTSVIKTLSGQWGNSILKANSNDVKTFGQFLKTEVFLTMANQPVPVSAEAGMTDIAGSNVIVELDKKTPIRVRLFVWLEGQDVDCWNDIAAGTFRINLELAGESVYKGENYKPEKDAEPEAPEEPEEPITMCTLRRDWLTMAEAGINKFYVESVEFTKTAPKNYTKKWNAGTEDGSKAIYAYEYGRRIYVVVPSGQDKIYFPEDSSELFFKLEHCTSMTGFQYVDTSNVTNMSSMFRACNAVKSLDLTSFNTEKVSSMIGMFWETFNLSTLDVSSFRTPSLVFMGGMFYRTGACELDLSGFDISNVDSLGNVFVECEDLQTIYVGSGWTQPNYAYCPNVFKRCHSLVGGNGTAYDPAHVDYTYARIDTAETPGYLTDKNAITVITCTLKGYGTDGNSSDGWFDSTAAGITRNQITALEFVKSVPTGYTATWNASAETGVQEIDAYLKGTTVSIVIPDGADRIYLPYNSAEIFKGLTACTSIDGTTYLDTSRPYNMFRMFAYCSNLTNVDVSNWDTSNVKTMTSMFDSCQKLKTVYGGSGWDISNDTSGADMFKDCVSLVGGNGTPYSSSYTDKTYARIDTAETPGYFTEKSQNEVEDLTLKPELTWLFDRQYKGNIVTVTFSKTAPASYVTTWRADNGSGPVGLTGYASGDVYGFDITIVIPEGADRLYFPADSSNLFSTMTVLNAINGLDLVDTSGVTDMSGMFSNIDDLRVLNLSGWDTSNVTNMAGMFEMATSLTTVYVGDKWSTESVPNGQNLFSGNRWLVGGNGTKYDANHVDKTYARIDAAGTPGYFTDIADKPAVVIGTLKGYGTNGNSSDGWFDRTEAGTYRSLITALEFVKNAPTGYTATWNAGTGTGAEAINAYLKGTTVSIVLPAGADKIALPKDSRKLFYDLASCTSIDGTCYLDTSAVTDMCEMFEYCFDLTSLDVSSFDTSAVTDMRGMFKHCKRLTSLDVSGFDTSAVADMGSMFSSCSKLTELDVGRFDTSKVTDMYSMFYYCSSLTSLDVSRFDTSKVTDMNSMFSGCQSLTSLDVSGFSTSKVTSMYGMFNGCSGLTGLDLSGFDTSKVGRMDTMFNRCSCLTTIYAGGGLTTSSVIKSNDMFNGCIALVGGNGTIYDGNHVDGSYARIDTAETPGYFTAK